jgi:hypothetical protein
VSKNIGFNLPVVKASTTTTDVAVVPESATTDLDELAVQIRAELQAMYQAYCNALQRAMNAGDRLLAAQAVHADQNSSFTKWLRTRCLLKERTAFLYMRLARNRAQIEAEVHRIGDLSIRRAANLIQAESKPPADQSPNGEVPAKDDPSAMVSAWEAAPPEAKKAFLDRIGVKDLLESISPEFSRGLQARIISAPTTTTTVKAEIEDLARSCNALLSHPEQHVDEVRKKLARIRTLNGGEKTDSSRKGKRKKGRRGVGLADPTGQKFLTINMSPTGTDTAGNTIYA